MPWKTRNGQSTRTYRPSTTRRTSKLSPIPERDLWRIIRNAVKTKRLFAKRHGRFVVY